MSFKKKVFLVICLLIGAFAVPEDFYFSFYPYEINSQYNVFRYQLSGVSVIYNDTLIVGSHYDGNSFSFGDENYTSYSKKIKIGNDSGFYYYDYFVNGPNNSVITDSVFFIPGKFHSVFVKKNHSDCSIKVTLSDYISSRRETFLRDKYKSHNQFEHGFGAIAVVNDFIKDISASSFLKETKTSYGPENLKNRLYVKRSDDVANVEYDYITPPWVEGVSGYGVGEYLDVEFDVPLKAIEVLNGFVDFDRPYLFKENSRVKTFLIESLDGLFSKEYELKDAVELTNIEFPALTKKVRITIKSVYPGTKYDDTCISGIIGIDPNAPSYEERKNNVINMMKANGSWNEVQ